MAKLQQLKKRLEAIESKQPDHEYWRRFHAWAAILEEARANDGEFTDEDLARFNQAFNHWQEWVHRHG